MSYQDAVVGSAPTAADAGTAVTTAGGHDHYSAYYDAEALALIDPWIQPDLVAFGYTFEDEAGVLE